MGMSGALENQCNIVHNESGQIEDKNTYRRGLLHCIPMGPSTFCVVAMKSFAMFLSRFVLTTSQELMFTVLNNGAPLVSLLQSAVFGS